MSFQQLKWTYQPPETLPPAPPAPVSAQKPQNAGASSRARALIDRIDDLNETARYLEKAIVERFGQRGIRLDLKANPELAIALERVYGSTPEAISVAMYDLLLDSESGIQRALIAIEETDSSSQVDPIQQADLQRINSAFEEALAEDATLDSALPLSLRSLKGDRIIFDNLKESLNEYPILAGTQSGNSSTADVELGPDQRDPETGQPLVYSRPSHELTLQAPDTGSAELNTKIVRSISQGIADDAERELDSEKQPRDVNPDTSANLHERMDAWELYYSGTMDLVSKIDSAYHDLAQFATTYLYRPLQQLEAILSTLAALRAFFHRPKLKDLRATMAAFILPRLVAEVGKYTLQLDRNVTTITQPVTMLIQSLGRLVGEASKIGTDVAYLAAGGGLTGMVRSRISGQYRMPTRKRIKALDTIPAGIAKLGAMLSWGMREMVTQQQYAETTLFKCIDSKLAGDGNRIEVMQALSSLDALCNITKGFIEGGIQSAGSGAGLGVGPIASAQSKVDQFIAKNSPDLPQITPPPARATAVFARVEARKGTTNA